MKLEIFAQLSEGKIVGHLSDEMHKVNNKSVVYAMKKILNNQHLCKKIVFLGSYLLIYLFVFFRIVCQGVNRLKQWPRRKKKKSRGRISYQNGPELFGIL